MAVVLKTFPDRLYPDGYSWRADAARNRWNLARIRAIGPFSESNPITDRRSKIRDDAVLVETIATLDAAEVAVVDFSEIFLEVAGGVPLDLQRAENLAAQCAELPKRIGETRNAIRFSSDSSGVH